MNADLTGIVALIVSFLAPVLIVKIISDNKVRQRLIDKDLVDEKVKYLFSDVALMNKLSSVKWGLVLIGIGVALIIGELARLHDELTFGIMFILAGLGFLIYYFIEKVQSKDFQNR